jgi:hypothetical protein
MLAGENNPETEMVLRTGKKQGCGDILRRFRSVPHASGAGCAIGHNPALFGLPITRLL